MIERLISVSLRYRVGVIAAVLARWWARACGRWANLKFDAFPDLTPNQVQVITVAPGLSPAEVENLVSYPMETAMMGLPRTHGVRSISKAGHLRRHRLVRRRRGHVLRAGAGPAAHAGRDGQPARRLPARRSDRRRRRWARCSSTWSSPRTPTRSWS